jgi:hypothetical protein
MSHRNLEIKVRFTRDELSTLDKKVKKTGMSREGYVRTICNNKTPVEIPPADYYTLLREVRALGNNLHQSSYKANALGFLDAPEFRRHADRITEVADKLTAVCLPRSWLLQKYGRCVLG